jgi:hypothetical protein
VSQQVALVEATRFAMISIEELCKRYGFREMPGWYFKEPTDSQESWPREGYVRKEKVGEADARRYWLEKSTALLLEARPDKGLLRTALESQKRFNPDLAAKLREKLRRLK